MKAKQVTVKLTRDDARKWGIVILAGGKPIESYPCLFSLNEAIGYTRELFRNGSLDIPRIGSLVRDANNSMVVDVDNLVELHLKQIFSALFESIEGQTVHVDNHIIGPAFEVSFEVSYGQPAVLGSGI